MGEELKMESFMKKLVARIQRDISKLQKTVHKEGNDLLNKIKKLDFKSNLESTRDELKKVLSAKLKKMEPTYHNFIEELRNNAKKAGIDVSKVEKNLKKKVTQAKKQLNLRSKQKAKSGLAKAKAKAKAKAEPKAEPKAKVKRAKKSTKAGSKAESSAS